MAGKVEKESMNVNSEMTTQKYHTNRSAAERAAAYSYRTVTFTPDAEQPDHVLGIEGVAELTSEEAQFLAGQGYPIEKEKYLWT